MRVENTYLRGTAVRLPRTLAVADAVAAGECPPGTAAQTGAVSVAVSPDESAAEMAAAAARTVLDRAGSTPGDVDLVLHADTYHQGQDLWPVASYIQRAALGNSCPALEIRQMSNGGLAALDLATAYLAAGHGSRDALLTTADRFCAPGIDRWRTDPGTPYADGATALVLSRRGGFARLLSLALHADPELEPLHRGDEPFTDAPFGHRMPVDFDAAKRTFVQRNGLSYAITRAHAGQQTVIKQALADAEIELDEARWIVLPHFGRRRLTSIYYTPFGIEPERTTWEFSRTVGHLGAGDQFAGLDHLVTTGRAAPGDRCVLVSVGAGYSWGCAVVEITDRPDWAGAR
ncbi:ketoacyl-ACP synthase III family protein [Streptomyces sp. NPDC014861]|uniref:ketoacyl-ACP synthase III family protein n=1 Tax=Streptomyces sp. NPDC014861 TaxID=3364923 RepID=UPI0036F624E0